MKNNVFIRSNTPEPHLPTDKSVCKCHVCREPVYPYELVHVIDGFVICPDCFFDFAFDYFSDRLILASELGGINIEIS